ncbi:MAG: MBL fold metallo-hydrolase [Pseudomonadota bacterium]
MKPAKFLVLLFLGLILSTSIQAWTLPSGNYQFSRLSANVYVMHGPLANPNPENTGFMNNPAFIESATGVILIDPGSSLQVGRNVIIEIEKITSKPVLAVFNSHIHGDHWLANHAIRERYPDAILYAHPNTIRQANNNQGLDWLLLMNRLTEGASRDTKLVPPDTAVNDGDLLKIDGEQFRVHSSLPSHTDTDIIIEHLSSKTLFLGDNVVINRLGRFDNSSSILGTIELLEAVNQLDVDWVVPGHGPSGPKSTSLIPYLNYLKKLKSAVESGVEEELEDYEIKQTIIDDFPEMRSWYSFNERFGVDVNKMYLELEEF